MTQTISVINLFIGIVGFVWLIGRTNNRWKEYPDEIQMMFRMTLALFFCLLAVSSVFVLEENPAINVVLPIFITKCYVLYVLWKTHDTKYRTGNRIEIPTNVDVNKDVPDE